MNDLIKKIFKCVEMGKINLTSPYPPDMKDQDGADELTRQALDNGIHPSDILDSAMIPAMEVVGNKFSRNEIFVPQMLMSAKAMSAAMEHIKPFFKSGEAKRKGVFIIGTVEGDLHDIGKNLVAMMIEGAGWEVIDLGVDVKTEQFISTINEYPGSLIGLSALITTTMENMKKTVNEVKSKYPETRVLIGGAPVTDDFRKKIGASFYSPDPQGAVNYLNSGLQV
ncbi:MAG TPA: cobalamin-binding protein [Bacteroidales bacterium]|nr:cobalamin-binding protein [Bacteroidales bacterium]